MKFKKAYDSEMFLEYPTLKELTTILNQLFDDLENHGQVYVAEVCERVGLEHQKIDWSWGWKSFDNLSNLRKVEGLWQVTFPKPIFLGDLDTPNDDIGGVFVDNKAVFIPCSTNVNPQIAKLRWNNFDKLEIHVNSKDEAESVLSQLQVLFRTYGKVRLRDVYTVTGINYDAASAHFYCAGWDNLYEAIIYFNQFRGWTLRLPRVVNVQKEGEPKPWFFYKKFNLPSKVGTDNAGHIEVAFNTREEAEYKLQYFLHLIRKFKKVTLGDVYEAMEEPVVAVDDDKYYGTGWTDLSFLHVCNVCGRIDKCNYLLCFPTAVRFTQPIIDEMHAVPFVFVGTDLGADISAKKITTMTLKDIEELSMSGEEFELRYEPNDPSSIWKLFKIYNGAFVWRNLRGIWETSTQPLATFIEADFRRLSGEPKQWKPKYGEKYWYVYVDPRGQVTSICTTFVGDINDLHRVTWKNCFKTQEEAHRDNTTFARYSKMKKEYDKR